MEIGAWSADFSLYVEFENRIFASLQIWIFTHSPVKSTGILSPFCRWINRGNEATQPVKDQSASNSDPSGLPPEPSVCYSAVLELKLAWLGIVSRPLQRTCVASNLEHY